MLNRMIDGLEGRLRAVLSKTSPDTALPDIGDLVEKGILSKDPGGGRSTRYSLSD